ncbi:hypothetical protein HPB47_011395 [Ixodes persulcatus]|uniref:Uncharacterized protein n=1 Tax=Ixodes persulcatus TaxID=34615 RepID=A0AC60NWG0_IXOPE|nr:hypothetical protein HPB47_011395 [Ixodes persulcatus]
MPATFRNKPSPFKFGGRKRFSKRRGSGRPPKEDDGSASSPFPSAPPSPSALESPIASLPPAERHPEPSASASSLPVSEISSEDDLTAIERKIAMMQRKAPAKYSEPDDPEKQLGLTECEELDGYRLLGVACIEALRMYAGLEALKKAKKGLGGKGKLTNLKMKQLTNYYACSLKDNAPDVTAMQRGVFASLLHSYSTDEEPRHALEAAGEPPAFRPHKPAFSKEIAREMTVECAVALAVFEFNLGPRGIKEALLEMGIQPGSYQASYGERATKMKVAKAQVKALESSKMFHKKRKMEAVAKAQRDRAEEGVTYAPGAF